MDDAILAFLQDYFRRLDDHDAPTIQKNWHPQGVLFINGQPRPQTFLQELPPLVGFDLQRIERIDVSGMAASAIAAWTMKMPGAVGRHVSHFGLVRDGEGWQIAAQIDFGTEEQGNGHAD